MPGQAQLPDLPQQGPALAPATRAGTPHATPRGEPPRAGRKSASHMPKSGSSATSHPPGASQDAIRRSTAIRSAMCISTARTCTRPNDPSGKPLVRTSWRSTVRFGSDSPDRKPVSRSVAVTCPAGSHVLAQPARDRAAAAAHLQAADVRGQAQPPDPPLGQRVQARGQQIQAAALISAAVGGH